MNDEGHLNIFYRHPMSHHKRVRRVSGTDKYAYMRAGEIVIEIAQEGAHDIEIVSVLPKDEPTK